MVGFDPLGDTMKLPPRSVSPRDSQSGTASASRRRSSGRMIPAISAATSGHPAHTVVGWVTVQPL